MSVVLLADDSPHALRMGEQILRAEGFDVISVTEGDAAAARLAKIDPDLLIADYFLPLRSGFELCRWVRESRRATRIILTAGVLESVNEDSARLAGCDAILRKPFEATALLETARSLVAEAAIYRQAPETATDEIRERVAKAVEAELPRFIREITEKILSDLKKS
jgi:DNA-binding response OmpR family regulator